MYTTRQYVCYTILSRLSMNLDKLILSGFDSEEYEYQD